jgi:hypothetical protein
MVILFLISLVINGILAYILHNSHENCGKCKPFTLPLILWIAFGITTFIPIINIVASIVYVIIAGISYSQYDIKLNDDFWLTKRY